MSLQTKEALRAYFENGKKPPQDNFWNLIDSFFHKSEGNVVTSTVVNTVTKTVTVNFSGGIEPLVFSTGGGGGLEIVTVDDVLGLTDALNSLVGKVPGQGLSQNNFTDADLFRALLRRTVTASTKYLCRRSWAYTVIRS